MGLSFVLVHGAWGGAWIWRRVLGPLRAAGHEAHALTLTGTGERAHLRHPGIGLTTHVQDVLALIEAEELERDGAKLVLVGHSYAGLVITAAADALLARAPNALRHLVYIDAQVPLPGESWSSLHAPELQAQREALAREHGGALPPPDPALFGLTGADRDWLLRRHTPHPFGAYREPIAYDAARLARVPRTYLACTAPAFTATKPHQERVRTWPGWRVLELTTGHAPMVSAPELLNDCLLNLPNLP
jgi:pimeloyl-ACP methyl ester carboxylesterase